MMDFAVKIQDWWAVEAMIASHNHAYQVIYGTTYEVHGPIGVSKYGNSHIAPYQLEFLALSQNPRVVTEAIREYPMGPSEKFILNIYHATPSDPALKAKYQSLGYDFIHTGPILGRELPASRLRTDVSMIHKVQTLRQAEHANEHLTNEGERISLDSLSDKHIHNLYAEVAGQAAGWAQLVTVYPGVGYLNHLYTLSMYRGLKIGSALVERAQIEAAHLGRKHIILIPTDLAMGLCMRLGYRPLAYITAFRPAEETEEWR
jgi:GNAT superfamily N-acetyltransferase